MVKKYVIEGVVALLLMILVLVGHMIEVKLEKEEKEYIDLKLQKQKTSFYNTIRDILMNIFMLLVFMCGKMYFNTDAILVFFPSFLLLFYYSNRREKRRFNIFLFLVFAVSGILTNNLITFVNVNVSIMLEIVLFLFFLVIYSRVKIVGIFGIASLSIFMRYVLIQEKELKEINEYIKEVNNKNYSLKIEDNKDGELSRLRNELYKTTVILREAAENSEEEKEKLSIAIADISHQLKTPLTSIRIMLDNISDNPDMPQEIREDFIQDISKQVEHMSSLVISLLKIAKFDAGTIKMENEEIDAKKLIDSVINKGTKISLTFKKVIKFEI